MKITKYKKKDGSISWGFKLYLGVGTDGRKKEISRSGFKTRRLAAAAADKALMTYSSNRTSFDKATYNDVFNLWYEQYKRDVKESTYHRVERDYRNHILPKFGNIKIAKITPAMCQKALNRWAVDFANYKNIKSYFTRVFEHALKLDIINVNPIDKVIMPKPKKRAKKDKALIYYTKPELIRFLNAVEAQGEPKWHAFFRVLAYSGARKGELLALEWEDVDFKNNTITISKTIAHGVGNKIIIQAPKTENSERIITMDPQSMQVLKEWRNVQKLLISGKVIPIKANNIVFTNNKGTYLNPPKAGQVNDRICRKYNLKRITIHGFRHTHCSLLFEAGASIKEVQERLGHDSIKTTMEIYAHVSEKSSRAVVQRFANFLK